MIGRFWHGWTTLENADTYERIVRTEVLPEIAARKIAGYRGAHLLRRPLEDEVEFVTIMWFDSLDAIRRFMGDDYEVAQLYRRKRERSSHGSTHGRNITKRSSCLKAEVVAVIFDSHARSRPSHAVRR